MKWTLLTFKQLSNTLLYEALRLRQDVFIIEQDCIYPDIDNLDPHCHHLFGLDQGAVAAYLRIVPGGKKYNEPSLGRIVVHKSYRGRNIGYALVEQGIESTRNIYQPEMIRIEAQAHLESFYQNIGFYSVTEPFEVDGIPHIEMLINLND